MQLQIGGDLADMTCREAYLCGIQSGILHRRRNRNAVAVRMRDPALRPAAGQPAAAQQRNAEAGALFIRKACYLYRQRQALPAIVQPLHGFNRAQHAQHTVIASGVAHGIKVRAEQQRRRARFGRLIAAADVTHRILPGPHTCRLHPLRHAGVSAQVFRRQINARQSLIIFTDRCQRITARHDACGGRLCLFSAHLACTHAWLP